MLRLSVFGINFFVLELLVVPGLTLAAFMILSNGHRIGLQSPCAKKQLNRFFMITFLFLLSVLTSSVGAINYANVLKGLFKWVEIFTIAGLVFVYASTERRFVRVWWVLWLSHFVVFALTFQHFGSSVMMGGLSLEGLRKISGHAAVFSAALIVPLAIRNRTALIGFAVLATAAFLSFSRGAWLIVVFLILNYFWMVGLFRNWRRTLVCAAPVILVVVAALLSNTTVRELAIARVESSFSNKLPSNRERVGMLLASTDAFLSNPVTGIGAENFADYLFQGGVPRYVSTENPDKITPHNFFMQIAAETGLLGFVTIALVFLFLGKILFAKSSLSKPKGPHLDGLKIYFVVLVFHLFTAFIATEFRFSIGLFMGLVMASLRRIEFGSDPKLS